MVNPAVPLPYVLVRNSWCGQWDEVDVYGRDNNNVNEGKVGWGWRDQSLRGRNIGISNDVILIRILVRLPPSTLRPQQAQLLPRYILLAKLNPLANLVFSSSAASSTSAQTRGLDVVVHQWLVEASSWVLNGNLPWLIPDLVPAVLTCRKLDAKC